MGGGSTNREWQKLKSINQTFDVPSHMDGMDCEHDGHISIDLAEMSCAQPPFLIDPVAEK